MESMTTNRRVGRGKIHWQNMQLMYGYIQKDYGSATYAFKAHNVDADELEKSLLLSARSHGAPHCVRVLQVIVKL